MALLSQYGDIYMREKEEKTMDFKYYMQRALDMPEEGDKIEYFNLKARISSNVLVNSQRNIPTPTYVYEADVTKFYAEYQKLKAECGYQLSFKSCATRFASTKLSAPA